MNNIIQPNVQTAYIIRYCKSRIVSLIYIIDLFFYSLIFLVQVRLHLYVFLFIFIGMPSYV